MGHRLAFEDFVEHMARQARAQHRLRCFGTVEAVARFCAAFDELRNYLRPRRTIGKVVSLLYTSMLNLRNDDEGAIL